MVPNLNKICRICLSLGSRSIFTENGSTNSSNEPNDRTDVMKKSDAMSLEKIAAKLRFVTLMKVSFSHQNFPHFSYLGGKLKPKIEKISIQKTTCYIFLAFLFFFFIYDSFLFLLIFLLRNSTFFVQFLFLMNEKFFQL
jgi:hypothetical protein